jgi:hypothetical protein
MPGTVPVPRKPELRGIELPNHEDEAGGPPVTVWFVSGYGAEVLEPAGAVDTPVPTPEVRAVLVPFEDHTPVEDGQPVPDPRTEDDADPAVDDALVALGNGNGGEEEPVARLVGAVPRPVVAMPQVLEFDNGKGGEEEELPEGAVWIPVPEMPVPPVGPIDELELLKGKGGRLAVDVAETGPVLSPTLAVGPPVGPATNEELLIGNGGDWVDVGELPVPATLVPHDTVPVAPVPCGRLVELEKGNGAELDPVADTGMPVPVPVGPNAAVDELLSGNGTLAVLMIDPPVPVEKIPDGPGPQDGDTAVGPVPEVELETGNGALEGVREADGMSVRDVIPVPGTPVPDGPDNIPVELPAEKGGPVGDTVPESEPPAPVPVADAVPFVTGKGVGEDTVQILVPDELTVSDPDPEV